MDERSNFIVAALSGAGSFVVTQRFIESFIVAFFLFVCGKAVDLFVKPMLEHRRERTRQKLRAAELEINALRGFTIL